MGGNTYQVNAVGTNKSTAKVAAFEAAKRTCTDAQREVLVQSISPLTNPSGYEVTFQCRKPGDPALQYPTYTRSPSVVIEDAR
jgi:hypothetical protein